jgi:hypothetical protein
LAYERSKALIASRAAAEVQNLVWWRPAGARGESDILGVRSGGPIVLVKTGTIGEVLLIDHTGAGIGVREVCDLARILDDPQIAELLEITGHRCVHFLCGHMAPRRN